MHRDREDSLASTTASNPDDTLAWNRLRRACGELIRDGGQSLASLLGLTVDASGFERAFLVRGGAATGSSEPYTLQASCCRRDDGRTRPSGEVLRRALEEPRTGSLRPAAIHVPADAASVRSLDLRSVIALPVPLASPERAALVLDSRQRGSASGERQRDLLNTFAALIGVALRDDPARPAGLAEDPAESATLAERSPAYRRMIDWVRRVAVSDLSVVIQGESGTGKERVCNEIHRRSSRGQGPLVAVNCSALPETLLEAELFGASRGAYTGADRDRPGLFRLADGGTLFLDEVADMPPAMQAKLLRALQERRVRPLGGAEEVQFDVRIVAASHRNLVDQVQAGCFRSDLYFRLSVLRVEVPPLRARLDDLPGLVVDLAPRLLRETGLGPPRLTPGAWDILLRHDWPGNIRELHSVLARALILSGGKELKARHVGAASSPALSSRPSGRQLEREMILSALLSAGGRIATAARSIGWSRQKLYRRIEALEITRPSFPESEGAAAAAQSSMRGTTSSESSTFQ